MRSVFRNVFARIAATARVTAARVVGQLFLSAVVGRLSVADGRSAIEEFAVFAHLARGRGECRVEHVDAHVSAAGAVCGQLAVGDGLGVAGDCVNVCAVLDAAECSVAGDCNEHVAVGCRVGEAAFESVASCASLSAVLTLAEGRDGHADAVQTLNVESQRIVERGVHVACCAGPVGKVVHLDVALDVSAEVGTSRIFQRYVRTLVDGASFLELNLAAVVEAGDSTECEHQREVFSPSVGALCEALVFRCTVWRVVVRVDVNHVV